MSKSLKATPNGAKQANEAFARCGKDQQLFANLLEISRTTLYKFLHEIQISRKNFIKICEELKLNWQDIAGLATVSAEPIKRDVEDRCNLAIEQRGAILRIKAPQQMGKATLMGRIFAHAEQNNYRTVILFWGELTNHSISNYDQFLLWFCQSIGQELEVSNHETTKYWGTKGADSNTHCRQYFTQHILPKIKPNSALVLGLHNVDKIFDCNFANDFFSMLRSWSDAGQVLPELWGKLRLVLAHSTEIYLKMDVEKSPFNVGQTITLDEFTSEQVNKLAKKYELNLNKQLVEKLMKQVGGHPYLVDLVIKYIKNSTSNNDISQLLAQESLENICNHYLNELWNQLDKSPKSSLMKQTLKDLLEEKLVLKDNNNKQAFFLLDSAGLVIELKNGQIKIRNNLYFEYLKKRLV
jgi:hypothetical protein